MRAGAKEINAGLLERVEAHNLDKAGAIPVSAKPKVYVLSCKEGVGGCWINGAFIAAGDRLAASDFLLRRGGFK